MMKYFALILSWILILVVGRSFKEIDGGLAAFGIVLMLGILMNFLPEDKNSRIRKIGWGFFYGAIAFAVFALALFVALSYSL